MTWKIGEDVKLFTVPAGDSMQVVGTEVGLNGGWVEVARACILTPDAMAYSGYDPWLFLHFLAGLVAAHAFHKSMTR